MRKRFPMAVVLAAAVLGLLAFWPHRGPAAEPEPAPISQDTETCLECHTLATPGIVADWKKSRHARTSPAQAMALDPDKRRFSAEQAPVGIADYAVGCAECHTLRPEAHPDTVDHEGYPMHIVVSPADCALCHVTEVAQYDESKMGRAHGILADNPVYRQLDSAINGSFDYKDGRLDQAAPDAATMADSCYQCHGTTVAVTGKRKSATDFGEFELPVLSGWPNQGVGRINPDGTRGSCAACHTRHLFSIETARQPYTCSQCHRGPDAPAYKVYEASKHGNLYSTHHKEYDFNAVPWVLGRDFTAPTCAVCHISQVEDADGTVLAVRTHRLNDRLPWRLFGVPYATAQPKEPDTSVIRNSAGQALPADLNGQPASEFLIDDKTVTARIGILKQVCTACHSQGWADGHFAALEHSIRVTNASTLAATRLMEKAWEDGAATGFNKAGANPFDEYTERLWTRLWLLHANMIRLSSAMGGADYGVFDGGRFQMSEAVKALEARIKGMQKSK